MQPMINALLDPVVNFGKVTVLGGYTDSIDDTVVTLITGDGSKLPNPDPSGSFNLVWFNNSTYSDPADDPYVEIVRCIARVGDTLTLMRGQELTARSNKNIPTKIYKMILSPTKKTIDDIQTESQSKVDTHSALSTGVHGVGTDTIDGVNARNIAISTHSSTTSNVHNFDGLGYAPAQTHGISRHTGIIGDHTANISNVGINTHDQIDTGITDSINHIAAVAPHSGHDTPAQRDTAIANHTSLTTAHGSVGTVLGLTTADGRYAPVSAGVSNGNAHDHSGGDGAQINHTTLSNIGINTHAQIDTGITDSINHIAAVAPHSGHDTPAQRDTAIANHTSLTTAHGSVGTVLGLTTADGRYAPVSAGVSNGNAHDHSGGDGAQINHTTLSNIGINTHTQIDTGITDSIYHIAAAAPHSGHDTPAQRDTAIGTAIDTHKNLITGVHGVTGSYILGTEDIGVANGVAGLDTGGKVPTSQLPALAITDVYTVASDVTQVALVAQAGDIAIRTDLNRSYVHNGGVTGTMSDWSLLLTPTDAVLSVFGRTGAVAATTNDYTWAQINKATSSIADITTRSHTALTDIGTNTHAIIDTAILNSTTHIGASIAHGVTSNIAGISDIQTLTNKTLTSPFISTIYGSSIANGVITIEGTSDATKTSSYVILQPTSGNVGIGTVAPTAKLHISGTPGVDGIKFPDGTLQTTAVAGPYQNTIWEVSRKYVFTDYTSGSDIWHSHDAIAETTSTGYVKLKTIKLGYLPSATLRIAFTINAVYGATEYLYGRIYRNGVAIGTEQARYSTPSGATEYIENIGGWNTNDELQIYAHCTASSRRVGIYNLRILGTASSKVDNY